MSNRMYTTKAIVCGSAHNMTSDKSYLLFTQELGMLWASARSVRLEKSKQRYALQDFSIIRVSLVQGKTTWRIGSVEILRNPFFQASTRVSRGGVAYVIKMLRRYIHGEEIITRTFSDAISALSIISSLDTVASVEVHQSVFMLRMLDELGYITDTQDIKVLLTANTLMEAVAVYDPSLYVVVTKGIEHASQVSHL